MAARITITGEVSSVRKIENPQDQNTDWYCLDLTTWGTGAALPEGLPMPSKDILFTVLLDKKQYDKVSQESKAAQWGLIGGRVLIQCEITLDLSFNVLEGDDMGIIAFQVEFLAAKKAADFANQEKQKVVGRSISPAAPAVAAPKRRLPKSPMKIYSIQIPYEFFPPREEKIMRAVEYYEEHGEFDQKILLEKGNNGWVLRDGYSRYLAAKRLGLDEADVGLYGEE
ncbi:hypothetical protein ACTHSJ_32420 [Paenibacillus cellulositrophicus]|uniref:hypothetical protein n=1 Tax=Paenibacillus cellulositrophicus TaxID=562959 RepID=UPI003F817C90